MFVRTLLVLAATVGFSLNTTSMASAGSAWDDLRPMLYQDRPIRSGDGVIQFRAPKRAEDDRRVPVTADAHFSDGRSVKSIAFIIDENPMPVVATFTFPGEHAHVNMGVDLRMNGPSPVHVVVEASDGQIYVTEQLIKTSGQGACAAPPVTDPKLVSETIGQMKLADITPVNSRAKTTVLSRRGQLEIRHPQATGMQMDQITLLFIPARYISTVSVKLGDETLFDMTAGFALAENPRIEFDYRLNGATQFDVQMKDTSDAAFSHAFPLAAGG